MPGRRPIVNNIDLMPVIRVCRRSSRQEALGAWLTLSEFVEENIDDVCAQLNSRWLVSICDTYADFGDIPHRNNALLISLLCNYERIVQTTKFASKPIRKKINDENNWLWDDNQLIAINGTVDVHINLFRRIRKNFENTPVLLKILRTIIKRMLKNKTTLKRFGRISGRNIYKDIMGELK